MSTYPINPYAPLYFQGANPPPSDLTGYEPRPFTYPYNPPNNELTANQALLNQSVAIDVDSDWLMLAWYISEYTGAFQIQLADSTGYYLSNGQINSGAISQSSSDPTVFSPAHPFPAGGKIVINITDLSGSTNPLQIAFVGIKLFRINKSGQ